MRSVTSLSSSISRRLSLMVVITMTAALLAVGGAARSAAPAAALEPGTGLPEVPRTDTPRFIGGTVTDQTVVGNRVIVVGEFEQVRDNDGTLLNQPYLAAYDINTGALDRSYSPVLDRPALEVEPDGSGGVIIGGQFNSVDGVTQRKLARLDSNGDRDTSFRASTSAKVTAIAVRNNRVYVGGPFTSATGNGTTTTATTLAAFRLSNGSIDTNFNFPIEIAAGRGGELSVKSLAFANDRLIVAHNGLTVAGQSRVGAAIIDTTPVTSPQLLSWRTDFFKINTTDAGDELAITDMAVSPDGSYFVIVSSGGDRPLQGRDAAVRFPVAGSAGVQPTWISRHFDSLFGVGISDKAIFIGGHFQFQEAPGSINPFPGDPNINYGTGPAGEGPLQLGNQVVARQQIGALNPTTGKSLNWNPGASAAIGVESLVVVDRGLLVGQDGDTLGGQDIGRHGFFDIENDVVPVAGLSTTISSHFNGETVDAGRVTVSGEATDGDAGVSRVQLAILETTSKTYLQADGSLGQWVGLNATLDTAGATATNWSRTLTIDQPGTYQVQAKTFTVDRRKDTNAPRVDLNVRPANDELPIVNTNTVVVNEGRVVTATGLATDDRGIDDVRVWIEDRATGEFLQADGTFAPGLNVRYNAALAAAGSPSTSWTYTFTVPYNGAFRVEASATDSGGQDDGRFFYRNFVVAENDEPPVVELGADTIELQVNQPFTIKPTISDDFGLDNARIRIRRLLTNEGTRPDGSFGANGTWVALDGIEGQTNVSPNFTIPAMPAGRYTLQLNAEDTTGQGVTVSQSLEVGPVGDAAPTVQITSDRAVEEAAQTMDLSGVAVDNSAVAEVHLYIRDRAANRWVDLDGSRTSIPVAHSANLASPNAASTTWTFSLTVDSEARYQFYAVSIDNAGQSSTTHTANHWYTPTDALPEVGLISPTDGDTIDGSRIFVSGRAEDDNEITRVRVRIRRQADNAYWRLDDSFGTAQWHNATLSNPGRPGTNWNISTPDFEPGQYRIQVLVNDDSGRSVISTAFVTLNG